MQPTEREKENKATQKRHISFIFVVQLTISISECMLWRRRMVLYILTTKYFGSKWIQEAKCTRKKKEILQVYLLLGSGFNKCCFFFFFFLFIGVDFAAMRHTLPLLTKSGYWNGRSSLAHSSLSRFRSLSCHSNGRRQFSSDENWFRFYLHTAR